MTIRPWREVAVPHEDVLKGTFQQAEFAADLSRVREGNATPEYQDPVLFFRRTYVTEGMRLLLDSVVKRLAGLGGDPVIQLQTAFGGGKTHTMMAVYHLAKGEAPASELQGIPMILDAAKVPELTKANVAVIDGTRFSPSQPKERDGRTVRTLWGELAWQLGGTDAYAKVEESDKNGTAPDSEVLESILSAAQPCVVLVDELVAYVRQLEGDKSYPGGTFDSNLTFVQNLTHALKAVPRAILLVSLPESKQSEAGSVRGQRAMDIIDGMLSKEALEKTFGRVHALWKPVATDEAFEIVRRRLFAEITDTKSAEATCRAFADFYVANAAEFPNETQESRYYDRLVSAYPIHPEIFARLYEDWSSLDNFQRTRGVLKLMAKVIHRLWKDGNNDPLVMPGSLPLYDSDTRNEAIYYLPQGWDPVIDRDVDGERSETAQIENADTRFGSVQACRRAARSVFLGSAPSTANQMVRGLEAERIYLGCVQPGQQIGVFKDALKRLGDRLHYLNGANGRYWFDTRPNLRREMEERKRRFQDKEDVFPAIRSRVEKSFASGVFGGIHVFTQSGDVPDDWQLRLVVLPPDAAYSKSGQGEAEEAALRTLRNRGDQPRQKQNRLVFLSADYDAVGRLRDQVRAALAWQTIVDDIRDMKLNLDQYQTRQATKSLDDANEGVRRTVRETYRWLLVPTVDEFKLLSALESRDAKKIDEAQRVEWERYQVNAAAPNLSQELEKVLKENMLLITEWSPIHLAKLLKQWFWKGDVREVSALDVWQKTNFYLYFPRLKSDQAFVNALAAGTSSTDFFGVAYGKEDGRYVGFSFGKATSPIFDSSLLLVSPTAAADFDAAERAAKEKERPEVPLTPPPGPGGDATTPPSVTPPAGKPEAAKSPTKKHFFGTVDLDPLKAKHQFGEIFDEVLQHFSKRHDVKLRISVEVEADANSGFDDAVQRTVKENCSALKFRNAEFEEES